MQQDGDIKAIWRQYQQAGALPLTDIDIAVAASFTVEPVIPYLGATLLGKGFGAPKIEVAPFNQLQQLCLDPAGVMGRDDFGVMMLLWRDTHAPSWLARGREWK
jgi:hypothetical protein